MELKHDRPVIQLTGPFALKFSMSTRSLARKSMNLLDQFAKKLSYLYNLETGFPYFSTVCRLMLAPHNCTTPKRNHQQ